MKGFIKLRQLTVLPQSASIDLHSVFLKIEGALFDGIPEHPPFKCMGNIELSLYQLDDEQMVEALRKGADLEIEIKASPYLTEGT